MQTYIATVKILVAAPSLGDACDAVAGALSNPINAAFVDWSYLPSADGKDFACPERHADLDPATAETFGYVEGSFLLTPVS